MGAREPIFNQNSPVAENRLTQPDLEARVFQSKNRQNRQIYRPYLEP